MVNTTEYMEFVRAANVLHLTGMNPGVQFQSISGLPDALSSSDSALVSSDPADAMTARPVADPSTFQASFVASLQHGIAEPLATGTVVAEMCVPVASYMCKWCLKSLKSERNLKVHLATLHNNGRHYKCDKCGMVFKVKAIWIKHLKRVHTFASKT